MACFLLHFCIRCETDLRRNGPVRIGVAGPLAPVETPLPCCHDVGARPGRAPPPPVATTKIRSRLSRHATVSKTSPGRLDASRGAAHGIVRSPDFGCAFHPFEQASGRRCSWPRSSWSDCGRWPPPLRIRVHLRRWVDDMASCLGSLTARTGLSLPSCWAWSGRDWCGGRGSGGRGQGQGGAAGQEWICRWHRRVISAGLIAGLAPAVSGGLRWVRLLGRRCRLRFVLQPDGLWERT